MSLCNVKALDGKVYKTFRDGWREREILAAGKRRGKRVWWKDINGRAVAISEEEAAGWGIGTAGWKVPVKPVRRSRMRSVDVLDPRPDVIDNAVTEAHAKCVADLARERAKELPWWREVRRKPGEPAADQKADSISTAALVCAKARKIGGRS